ncbi:MAG TPA: BON domain-containing protein [Usitatibacter sp.]|nr:BON domain-containing protein [Usitatibacter sp.]
MRSRTAAALLLASAAAFAAPAFADVYAPEVSTPIVRAYTVEEAPVVDHSVPAGTYYVEEPSYVEAPIVVIAPAQGEDALITRDVVDTIANDPRIPGDPGVNIGVSTFRNDVTLTGRVITPRQGEIAAEDAHSVDGVRDVYSDIRPRVGGS